MWRLSRYDELGGNLDKNWGRDKEGKPQKRQGKGTEKKKGWQEIGNVISLRRWEQEMRNTSHSCKVQFCTGACYPYIVIIIDSSLEIKQFLTVGTHQKKKHRHLIILLMLFRQLQQARRRRDTSGQTLMGLKCPLEELRATSTEKFILAWPISMEP